MAVGEQTQPRCLMAAALSTLSRAPRCASGEERVQGGAACVWPWSSGLVSRCLLVTSERSESRGVQCKSVTVYPQCVALRLSVPRGRGEWFGDGVAVRGTRSGCPRAARARRAARVP